VYTANFGASSVTVIATATNTVSGLISVGRDPSGVTVSQDGARVYVTSKAENSVSVITAATNVVTATITVDTNPVGIVIAPDGTTVYAANSGSTTVSTIAVATNTVTGAIAVGAGPFGIAIPRALPPGIVKSFGAARIALDGMTSLSFTLTNPNITARLTGIAFTDNLPAGLVVASPGNLTNTCGGSATATDGSSSISLSGVALAAGVACTVSVSVNGNTAGVKNNSVSVTSANGGTGNTSNATLTVVAPPTLAESFGAAGIPLNGTASLSFTLNNPNSADTLTGIGFSDTLPSGLVISTPSGRTGTCGGGTIAATQGANAISLAGASLPAGGSCSFSLNVTGIAAGTQNNTTGSVTSTEGGTGSSAFAAIVVTAPPSLAQAFNPTNIALNATSSLTFTITNPAANVTSLTGVAFTDTLPAGLTVADASSTVCGGTLTTTAPSGIALSGATIAVNSQCQFSITVTGPTSGLHTNTTGNVTSANGGIGNAATAGLTVAVAPGIAEVFGVAGVPLNGTTSLTLRFRIPIPAWH
jgi:fimbrial isopeptide formation D2 family protein